MRTKPSVGPSYDRSAIVRSFPEGAPEETFKKKVREGQHQPHPHRKLVSANVSETSLRLMSC